MGSVTQVANEWRTYYRLPGCKTDGGVGSPMPLGLGWASCLGSRLRQRSFYGDGENFHVSYLHFSFFIFFAGVSLFFLFAQGSIRIPVSAPVPPPLLTRVSRGPWA